jgi:inorganic pyrophosphatase
MATISMRSSSSRSRRSAPSLLVARPIGVLRMRDDKGLDDKIIAVPVADPRFHGINEFRDIAPHWQKEIDQFFRTYKHLQDLQVDIYGWRDRTEAYRIITAARLSFRSEME